MEAGGASSAWTGGQLATRGAAVVHFWEKREREEVLAIRAVDAGAGAGGGVALAVAVCGPPIAQNPGRRGFGAARAARGVVTSKSCTIGRDVNGRGLLLGGRRFACPCGCRRSTLVHCFAGREALTGEPAALMGRRAINRSV